MIERIFSENDLLFLVICIYVCIAIFVWIISDENISSHFFEALTDYIAGPLAKISLLFCVISVSIVININILEKYLEKDLWKNISTEFFGIAITISFVQIFIKLYDDIKKDSDAKKVLGHVFSTVFPNINEYMIALHTMINGYGEKQIQLTRDYELLGFELGDLKNMYTIPMGRFMPMRCCAYKVYFHCLQKLKNSLRDGLQRIDFDRDIFIVDIIYEFIIINDTDILEKIFDERTIRHAPNQTLKDFDVEMLASAAFNPEYYRDHVNTMDPYIKLFNIIKQNQRLLGEFLRFMESRVDPKMIQKFKSYMFFDYSVEKPAV